MFASPDMSPRSKQILVVVLVAAVFLALRLPGIHLPYHQDEWKNVATAETAAGAGTFFAHPPLMQILFVGAHNIFGVDYLRLFPLIFSVGAAILLYLIMRGRAGERAALFSVGLFVICFYNILGSLSPDVDGAILPFLFLLSVFAYDRWSMIGRNIRSRWFVLLILALLAGFLVKLNFILVIGAIILDYLWSVRKDMSLKRVGAGLASIAAFGVVYIGLLYLIQYLYPAFSMSLMLDHASQYAGGRNWTQIIVQGAKAIYYISPLMLVPLIFTSRETFRKTLIFWLYLAVGFIFYFVLFDFSRAALDKYLMFAIVPLAAIVGTILSKIFDGSLRLLAEGSASARSSSAPPAAELRTPPRGRLPLAAVAGVIIGLIIAIILIALNFLPHSVVALYPKTEWFSRVLHGHWNILTPLNGGSGPMGFYMSFLFIAVAYIVSITVAIIAWFKESWRASAAVILIIIGLAYNGAFAQELLHGGFNGNAPKILGEAIAYIDKTDNIKKVITYNDIGNGPLSIIGKYAGRIYATPEAEEGYRKKFTDFDGHYLVVDIPTLYQGGFYYRFFAQCRPLFSSVSGKVTANVYDCPHDAKTINSL